jgi:cytochrome c nitrite reductase small subunit
MRGRTAWTIVAVTLGTALGVGAYTFVYAKGASYLTTDPAACANCHVMQEHFDAWLKSSHRNVATCSDCHMPHDILGKYMEKARNGFLHSLAFTTGRYPDPLQIRPGNREVTESMCRSCHGEITEAIEWEAARPHSRESGGERSGEDRPQIHDGDPADSRFSCIRCHTYVGHMVR